MNTVIYNILYIAVVFIAAIVARFIVPYIKGLLSRQENQYVTEMIKVAVWAAEQTVKGSGQGEVKKEQVLIKVRAWLAERGIAITESQLDSLIEAAVFEMNKGDINVKG